MNKLLDRKYVSQVGSVGTFKARAEDYTPKAENRQRLPGREPPTSGGADDFLGVIEHELKLLIAKRYTVDARRQALLWLLYGGLFTLYTLLTKRQAFQGYVAASPSIWWYKGYVERTLEAFEWQLVDQPVAARMAGIAQPMVDRLQRLFSHGLHSEFQLFPGANHGTNAAHSSIVALALAAAIPRSGRVRMAKATRTDRSAG